MAHPLIKYHAAIKREDSLSDVEDLQGILSKKKKKKNKLQNNVNVILKVHIYYLYAYILYTYISGRIHKNLVTETVRGA